MRKPLALCLWTLLSILPVGSARREAARPQQQPAKTEAAGAAGRAMEVHTDAANHISVVVFHQRDDATRAALAELLHAHSGDTVEIQAGNDHSWRRATVFRLKSCFGRGLLLVPAGGAQLKEGAEFLLKFPPD